MVLPGRRGQCTPQGRKNPLDNSKGVTSRKQEIDHWQDDYSMDNKPETHKNAQTLLIQLNTVTNNSQSLHSQ